MGEPDQQCAGKATRAENLGPFIVGLVGGRHDCSRYSPDQDAFGLRHAEEGTPVSEVCSKMASARKPSTAEKKWRQKFQGMGVAEVRHLQILEEENRKLRQLVADLSLDKQMLQGVLRKKA